MSEERPKPEVLPTLLADSVGFLLKRAQLRAFDHGRAAMPHGEHPRLYAVLSCIADAGPLSQQALAERLNVNRTIMVKLIDSLEADDLVTRERNPLDRRSYALVLTGAGRARLRLMEPGIERGEAGVTAFLTEPERARLADLLRRMLADRLDPALPPSLTGRTAYLLIQAQLKAYEVACTLVEPLGLAPPHLGALAMVEDDEPCSQQRIAQRLGVSGTLVVRFTDELEERGLVERRRNPLDRRSYALALTPAGHEVMGQMRDVMAKVNAEVAAPLSPPQCQELAALLRKLVNVEPADTT